MKPRSLKLYRASSVVLSGLPAKHRAMNHGTQVAVLIRCVTKRRFAEILASYYRAATKRDIDAQYRYLATYCSWHQLESDYSQWDDCDQAAVKPDTVYYNPEHHCPRLGYMDQWFELPACVPKKP